MATEHKMIFDLGIVLLFALFSGAIAQRIRVPSVIGVILAGILLNPFTPGYVIDSTEIFTFAQLGAILIMFVLGLQFEHTYFRKIGLHAFIIAGVASFFTFVAGFSAGILFDFGAAMSLLLGAVFVSTSTTIALKLYDDMEISKTKSSEIVRAAIVIDDLYGFLALAFVSSYTGTGGGISEFLFSGVVTLAFALLVFFLGTKIAPKIFTLIEKSFPNTSLALGTSFCLILSYFVVYFNLSPIIGAFLAGTILTSTMVHKNVLNAIMPVRNLFAVVFFISIGLLLNPWLVLNVFPLAIFLSMLAIFSKAVPVSLLLTRIKTPLLEAFELGLTTGPRGEVTLIIAQTAVMSGIADWTFFSVITSIVILTTILTPFLISVVRAEKSLERELKRKKPLPKKLLYIKRRL